MNNKNMENSHPLKNLKDDLRRAKAELDEEAKVSEEARIAEEQKELVGRREAEGEREKIKERERLSELQKIFPTKKEWKELSNSHKAILRVYLSGRQMVVDEIVKVIGENNGEVLDAKFKEIIGNTKDGATLIRVEI